MKDAHGLSTKGTSSRRLAATLAQSLLPCLALLISLPTAAATPPPIWQSESGPEAKRHVSFVRTFDGAGIAFEDWALRDLLKNNVGAGKRWSAVDIVMQQCFSGGFVNDVLAAGVPATIVASAGWNEVSWTVQEAQGFQVAVENFTRAWVSAAAGDTSLGMLDIAAAARNGDWAGPISQDFRPNTPEHPVYGSSDANPGGSNDIRTLVDATDARLFTSIGLFGKQASIAPRHFTNALRIANLMRDRTEAARIGALYGSGAIQAIGQSTPSRPDTQTLPDLPINGALSKANVAKLFDGSLFTAEKQEGDRLLFYATGHGGQALFSNFGYEVTESDGAGQVTRYDFEDFSDYPQQREAGGLPSESFNPNMFGDSDESTDLTEIQLSLLDDIGDDTRILINGIDVTSLAERLTNPEDIRLLPQLSAEESTPTARFVWQVKASPSLLFPDPLQGLVDIAFVSSSALGLGQRSLIGVSVWSGDNEFVAVNAGAPVPLPAAFVLLASGLLALRPARRRLGPREMAQPHA